MNNRSEIQKLALLRLREAKVLFDNKLYDGTVYMAGYSIELAFKAAICKNLSIDDFFCPNKYTQAKIFKTHNLSDLLIFSGLFTEFESEKIQNQSFFHQWSYLQSKWSEQLRYEPVGNTKPQDAEKLLRTIEDPHQGILQWIQKHW
ncbi:MAG: HEPN domain-containing protein [Candidatus Kapaibacterium sp.]|nr:MAG: HEPN domain-containing protein [Candidatus Kapabacteria bacterium]